MDWTHLNAFFGVLAALAGGLVFVAALRRGQREQLNQALTDLQALCDVQAKRIALLQDEVRTLSEELTTMTRSIHQLQEDNLSLVRQNRMLAEPPASDRPPWRRPEAD